MNVLLKDLMMSVRGFVSVEEKKNRTVKKGVIRQLSAIN